MSLCRPFAPEEAVRACSCGHRIVCRVGERCPRCNAPLISPAPDALAVQETLVQSASIGEEHLARLAPILGVRGKPRTDGARVLGAVDEDAA